MDDVTRMQKTIVTGGDPGEHELVLGPQIYAEAKREGMSLTGWLESKYPSKPTDELDAFERQLLERCGIRVYSDARRGVWSSTLGDMDTSKHNAKALVPELIRRIWYGVHERDAKTLMLNTKSRFYQSSDPVSDVLYPDYLQSTMRQRQVEPAIPLSRLIAITTPVDSGSYDAFYLTDDQDERTMRRVAEGADVPTATLTGADHSVKLRKYGRRLLGTYEAFRRMRIDMFARHLALLALQVESDKVDTVIDIAINGDGNANTTATNYNLTTLDTAAIAGTPTLTAYLNWRMQWPAPYMCDVILAREAHTLELLLCNAGTANVLYMQVAGTFGIGGLTPIGPQLGPAAVGWDSSVPAETWLGLDSRYGIEMVVEMGSELVETNKIIASQYNEFVMTENVAFVVHDAAANRTVTLNA